MNYATSVKTAVYDLMYQQATDTYRKPIKPTQEQIDGKPLQVTGHVGMSPLEMSKLISVGLERRVDPHNVVNALYSLKGMGIITFGLAKSVAAARKAGGGDYQGSTVGQNGIPVRIRFSKTFMRKVKEHGVKPALVTEDIIPVDKDKTNGAGQIHDVEVEHGTIIVDKDERVTGIVPEDSKVVAQLQRLLRPEDYPEINRLAKAPALAAQAAKLLRDAGMTEHAEMVEQDMTKHTSLEQEAIDLWLVLEEGGVTGD